MIKNKKVVILIVVLILLALYTGYDNRDKLFWAEKEINIAGWEKEKIDNTIRYYNDIESVNVKVESHLKPIEISKKIKDDFSDDDWDADNCNFANTDLVAWVSGNNLISFDANTPQEILTAFKNDYPPDCDLLESLVQVQVSAPQKPRTQLQKDRCGNRIIEPNLKETCEPPLYQENNAPVCIESSQKLDLRDLTNEQLAKLPQSGIIKDISYSKRYDEQCSSITCQCEEIPEIPEQEPSKIPERKRPKLPPPPGPEPEDDLGKPEIKEPEDIELGIGEPEIGEPGLGDLGKIELEGPGIDDDAAELGIGVPEGGEIGAVEALEGLEVSYKVTISTTTDCSAADLAKLDNLVIPIQGYELISSDKSVQLLDYIPTVLPEINPFKPQNPMIEGFGTMEIDLTGKTIDFVAVPEDKEGVLFTVSESPEEEGEEGVLFSAGNKETNQITGAVAMEPGEDEKSLVLSAKIPEDEEIDPETLTFLAKVDGQWEIIPTTREGDQLIAKIDSATKYKNEDGKLLIGLYGTICDSCKETTFEKVYDPGTKDAVILVHGLFSSPKTYDELIKNFKITKQPFQIWTYGYPSKLDYDTIKIALEQYLEENADSFDTIKIVGHSIGGLVVQDVLWHGYNTGKQFVKKVKQVIVVGTPNLGSSIDLQSFKNILLNSQIASRLLGINPELVEMSEKGKTIQRVPEIEYDVIAGTRPYKLHIGAKLLQQTTGDEPNDGVVTVLSAQTVGGEKVDDRCYNYYDPKLNHNELIDLEPAIRIIGRLLTKEYKEKEPEKAWMGYNKFLVVENAQPETDYSLVLKKIDENQTSAPLLCNCGNGVCGEGEDELNCPIDCAKEVWFIDKYRYANILAVLLLLASLIVIITKGQNKAFYIVMAATLGAIVLINVVSEKIPFILGGIWLALLIIREKTKPRIKLPLKLEFNIKLAEADERILHNKSTEGIYDRILKVYTKLEEKDKAKAYALLLRFSTLETLPKKDETIKNLEETIERISQETLTKQQKRMILHKLGHMSRYSEKIKKIMHKMRK